jgi:hypothetical protein
MKLTFLPTLTDLREMLGERLYIEFVWMWREQEQTAQALERRASWGSRLPARSSQNWPRPLVVRSESLKPVVAEARSGHVALLHPNLQRLIDQRPVKESDRLEKSAPGDKPDAPTRRARNAALRSAAE